MRAAGGHENELRVGEPNSDSRISSLDRDSSSLSISGMLDSNPLCTECDPASSFANSALRLSRPNASSALAGPALALFFFIVEKVSAEESPNNAIFFCALIVAACPASGSNPYIIQEKMSTCQRNIGMGYR